MSMVLVGVVPAVAADGPEAPPAGSAGQGSPAGGGSEDRPRPGRGASDGRAALVRRDAAPEAPKVGLPERVEELVEARTARSKRFRLADGREQVQLSTSPVHYRDADGAWREIDTSVGRAKVDGFAFGNTSNRFTSRFGTSTGRLVRFAVDGRQVTLGVGEDDRQVRPQVEGDRVTYPDVFGDADVVYEVGPSALKESIRVDGPVAEGQATFSFTMRLAGLEAEEADDGSLVLYRKGRQGPPVARMPAPFMIDQADDAESPYGKTTSRAVTRPSRSTETTWT